MPGSRATKGREEPCTGGASRALPRPQMSVFNLFFLEKLETQFLIQKASHCVNVKKSMQKKIELNIIKLCEPNQTHLQTSSLFLRKQEWVTDSGEHVQGPPSFPASPCEAFLACVSHSSTGQRARPDPAVRKFSCHPLRREPGWRRDDRVAVPSGPRPSDWGGAAGGRWGATGLSP